jgi:DNA replication protein DnaC
VAVVTQATDYAERALALAAEKIGEAPEPTRRCLACGFDRNPNCDNGFVYLREEEDGTLTEDAFGAIASRCRNIIAKAESDRLALALDNAGVSGTIYERTWADLKLTDAAWKVCKRYGDRITDVIHNGLNLLLIGPRGTGKTQAATLLCAEAIKAGFTAVRVDWGKFVRKVRATYGNGTSQSEDDLIEALVAPALVLLDDVGASDKASDHNERLLTAVIGERYDRGRPTIITANLNKSELEAHLGARAAARIDGASDWVAFRGPVYRKEVEGARVAGLIKEVRGK